VLNAGAALWVAEAAPDLAAGVVLARRSIASGAAKAKLAALIEASRALAGA
jgi:anthranilate phosphoribosyltransferase